VESRRKEEGGGRRRRKKEEAKGEVVFGVLREKVKECHVAMSRIAQVSGSCYTCGVVAYSFIMQGTCFALFVKRD